MVRTALRTRFVDAPDSLGARRRARRWMWLVDTFPDLDKLSVIDLGGSVESWRRAPVRPKQLLVVNLEDQGGDTPDWCEVEYADACALPEKIASRWFDLAFSNSVIEHVGGHERRLRFAEAIRGIADAYWVQTPNRYFPIEPHWLAPGAQFLPVALRAQVVRRWPLVHTRSSSRADALDAVLWTELVDRTQMRHYFPDGTLLRERMMGLAKSLIAVRKPEARRVR